MQLKVIGEYGFDQALLGLGLSYGLSSGIDLETLDLDLKKRLEDVALNLTPMDNGHNKFLRCMVVYLDIIAPRFWWLEMDQYKVSTVSCSESTVHTLRKTKLDQSNFESPIPETTLARLSQLRTANLEKLKNELPEGFLQRRIVLLNYAVLRNIISQRRTHKLPQWGLFCKEVYKQVEHPEFLEDLIDEEGKIPRLRPNITIREVGEG